MKRLSIIIRFLSVIIGCTISLVTMSGCQLMKDDTASDTEPSFVITESEETELPEPDTEIVETGSEPETETEYEQNAEEKGILTSPADIELKNPGGDGKEYSFVYADEEFHAIYTPDNWKVVNSWRITNEDDITIICRALQEEHPIHGIDGASYRTPQDMAFEWQQHNIAYKLLPEDNPWRENVKDVDLNPSDQGKTFEQMYEDRTGKKFDPRDFL